MKTTNQYVQNGEEEFELFKYRLLNIGERLSIERPVMDIFLSKWYRTDAKAKTVLFAQGNYFDEIWFVAKGCVRAIRVVKDIPWTYLLHVKDQFTTEYLSYVKEIPGKMSFESVTDAVIFRIKKKELLALYEQYPATSEFGLYIAKYAYLHTFHRILDLQLKSLKERYLDLMKKTPLIFELAPQQDIASFLGVTPESLSRLRADLAKENKEQRQTK